MTRKTTEVCYIRFTHDHPTQNHISHDVHVKSEFSTWDSLTRDMLAIPSTLIRELGGVGGIGSPAGSASYSGNRRIRVIGGFDLTILKDGRGGQ